jgi:ferredoxin
MIMATATTLPSLNEASERDPHNNNSYGTLVDRSYLEIELPILDVRDFNDRVIRGYEDGTGEKDLPADIAVARSLIPAGTATLRDFSYVAPEIPEYIPGNCTGCMDCVTECPDTAILGKVLAEPDLEAKLQEIEDPSDRAMFEEQWSKTRKYYDGPKKKGKEGGRFASRVACTSISDMGLDVAIMRSPLGSASRVIRSLAVLGCMRESCGTATAQIIPPEGRSITKLYEE